MSSSRFFVPLPVQSLDGSVRRQYSNCMPIVFICADEKHAAEVASAVASVFSSWKAPGVEEQWQDEELLRLNAHPILNGIRRKLYVFLRPDAGQKVITTDYINDIFSLFKTQENDFIPMRRVETLAQALMFIMAKGDTRKLVDLGCKWAERRRSSRLQAIQCTNGSSTPITQNNSASASVSVPTAGDLPSGRKAPRCTKCHEPMKGHNKLRCWKITTLSLDAAIKQLSLEDECNEMGDQPPLSDPAPSNEAHCFIISSNDVKQVDAVTEARGLKSRTIELPGSESREVAYIVARSTGPLEALATKIIKTDSRAYSGWLRVSSAAAVGAITAWASLAYL